MRWMDGMYLIFSKIHSWPDLRICHMESVVAEWEGFEPSEEGRQLRQLSTSSQSSRRSLLQQLPFLHPAFSQAWSVLSDDRHCCVLPTRPHHQRLSPAAQILSYGLGKAYQTASGKKVLGRVSRKPDHTKSIPLNRPLIHHPSLVSIWNH